MENQHRLVKGYRDLSQTEIDLMNEVKGLEQQVGQLWQRVRDADTGGAVYMDYARSQLQGGFMWLVKAIGKSADPFSERVEAVVEQDWVDLEKTRDSLKRRIAARLGQPAGELIERLRWVEKKLADRQP